MTKIPTLTEVEYELCRKSYEEYCAYTHKKMYTRSKFTHYITNMVQEFIETKTNNAYDILCLSVPPQHGKSMNITETLPSWLMGKYPTFRIIMASYNEKFASKFLRRNRAKINEFGTKIFKLVIAKDSAEEIENTLGGSIISKGLLGGISGNPGEIVIVDDPIKNRQDADSPTIRETLQEEWINSIKSRLQPGAKVIVIQTRWHQQDLIGYLMETESNVTYINLPIECMSSTDVMGRVYGELLCPEIGRTREWWDNYKISFETEKGSRASRSLYYGNPSNDEGGLFQRHWFKYYADNPKFAYAVISLDATFKGKEDSDFVSIEVWTKLGQDYHLRYKLKKRMGFVETLNEMAKTIRMYGMYNAILVEDKANGSAIIEVLRKRFRSVIAIEPYGSKLSRASAVSPIIEAGNVYIREEHSSLVDEAVDFPNSDHDDEVDCMTQALNYMKNIIAVLPEPKEEGYHSYNDDINAILDYQG